MDIISTELQVQENAINAHTYDVEQCLFNILLNTLCLFNILFNTLVASRNQCSRGATPLHLWLSPVCDCPIICGQLSAPLSWIWGITLAGGQGPEFDTIWRYVIPL